MPNPVVHFEVLGTNGKKSQKFYGDLFDWNIDANNPMDYGMVQTNAGMGIDGGIMGAEEAPRVTFYVQVDDINAYLARAQGLGGKTVMPRTVVPNVVTMALFADPDGNVIGLVEE